MGEAAARQVCGLVLAVVDNIYGVNMVSGGPLMLKAGWVGGGMQAAQDYGKNLSAMM